MKKIILEGKTFPIRDNYVVRIQIRTIKLKNNQSLNSLNLLRDKKLFIFYLFDMNNESRNWYCE